VAFQVGEQNKKRGIEKQWLNFMLSRRLETLQICQTCWRWGRRCDDMWYCHMVAHVV